MGKIGNFDVHSFLRNCKTAVKFDQIRCSNSCIHVHLFLYTMLNLNYWARVKIIPTLITERQKREEKKEDKQDKMLEKHLMSEEKK